MTDYSQLVDCFGTDVHDVLDAWLENMWALFDDFDPTCYSYNYGMNKRAYLDWRDRVIERRFLNNPNGLLPQQWMWAYCMGDEDRDTALPD